MFLLVLFLTQRKQLYRPEVTTISQKNLTIPESEKIYNYEEIWLPVEGDVRLHCYWIRSHGKNNAWIKPKSVIMFRGSIGSVGHALFVAAIFSQQLGANVFLISYRGYGKSTGSASPTETGLRRDALAAYRWVAQKSTRPIVVHGYSLGAAVAIALVADLAAEAATQEPKAVELWKRLGGLVVESAFLSIPKQMPVFNPLFVCVAWMCLDTWNSEKRLKKFVELNAKKSKRPLDFNFPILFLSGEVDPITLHSHMKQLYAIVEKSLPKTKFVSFPAGTHDNVPEQHNYVRELEWAF